ncbi:exostosin-3-like protein [Leptotrombidium deliense]|uniref:glucuronosyl-galactosyl-proteoglycan 4-alpha-N-acetylglucosaminyltransferase n=1 Tax=Leptotrombidium deliense TaxID=299467 RepID=A0A443SIG6_9ACAR|nr:exostosin-3-like protein [Leptotrombidium deliense]
MAKICSLKINERTMIPLPSVRMQKVMVLLLVLLITVPFLTHYYISKVVINSEKFGTNVVTNPSLKSITYNEYNWNDVEALQQIANLKLRVKEIMRIRGSVSNELKSMESKRQSLLSEINSLSQKLDEIKGQLNRKQSELRRVHVSLEQAKFSQIEAYMKNPPFIAKPLPLLSDKVFTNEQDLHFSKSLDANSEQSTDSSNACDMHRCFDYSKCSLISGFPIFHYRSDEEDYIPSDSQIFGEHTNQVKADVFEALDNSIHTTSDASIACLFVVVLFHHRLEQSQLQSYLNNLAHWAEGRNHVIINLMPNIDLIDIGVNPRKALVIQSQFSKHSFRNEFDIVSVVANNNEQKFPSFSPSKRSYLASFRADFGANSTTEYQTLISILKTITRESGDDIFKFELNCSLSVCAKHEEILLESTFALIIPNSNSISSQYISETLIRMLRLGAVPILIGGDYIKLPFHEVIDWRLAVIHLPVARVTELHFILKSFNDNDIFSMRRHGRLLYSRYLKDQKTIVNTILAVLRQKRLQIAAPILSDEPSVPLFNKSFPMKYFDPLENMLNPDSMEPDENLGPIEPPFSSISYQRNYSLTLCHSYELWNSHELDPFNLYPYTPFDPILPSEAKFKGSTFGFRPIGGGSGGAGKEFSESLGGNVPKEQFTIVILTYEREAVLIDSLLRLKGLPHLNKILVIWNSADHLPSPDLKWPDVGVEIKVIRAQVNSLNNRFKPYDEIETEAVLSMDDDAHLRHDEIIFGFRVWRESRDRIVGFPGRYHAWDASHSVWLYNSNYSCELSMVLTGAAFLHKYYTYLYTYSMPSSIRRRVDEYMNCEDIAMNFLVSHITRKPPLKVTSRWTFRCPGCPVSLSEDDSHFQERHRCINYFAEVYGYNPLLNTQFRADSVLFKTRIPHDKQKCFKFI